MELRIEQLVLHGFPEVDGAEFSRALEVELSRILEERGVARAQGGSQSLGHLDGGAFELPPNASTRAIAAKVAQAIHGGLSP